MDFGALLLALRSHWRALIVCIVLGAALGYGWAAMQSPVYTATSSGTVTNSQGSRELSESIVADNLAKSRVKSYVEWGTSRSVAEFVIDKLNLPQSPEQLVRQVSITNTPETPVIQITANASSPTGARDLATAWIEGLAAEGEKINGKNSSLTLVTSESANLPTSPSFPNTYLAIALGTLLGMLAGLVYALVFSITDKRLRSAAQVERLFELPVVGMLPEDSSVANAKRVSGDGQHDALQSFSPLAESVRELRTNLQFMNIDKPPRTITISSPVPGDGKSTVVANLANAIASAGSPVIVIDGDLRRPTLARTFGLVDAAGLTNVLIGNAQPADVLQSWGTTGNLHIMASGKLPPNPSEVLGSQRMRELISFLSEHATVIIDAPPLVPVTDAIVLAKHTDGIIVTCRAGRTTSDVMAKALANLDNVGIKPLGIVLNRLPKRGPNSGYYGHKYGYYRSSGSTTGGSNSKKPADSSNATAGTATAGTASASTAPASTVTTGTGSADFNAGTHPDQLPSRRSVRR